MVAEKFVQARYTFPQRAAESAVLRTAATGVSHYVEETPEGDHVVYTYEPVAPEGE